MDKSPIAKLASLVLLLALLPVQQLHADCDDKRNPGMDWTGCKKINKFMDGSNFVGSRFDRANLTLSKLDDSDFTDASLVKTNMTRTSARNSRFVNADMNKAVGYRARFHSATVAKTNLSKSEFSRAEFNDAEISDTDWSKSELGRADFTGASLRNVEFDFTNLARALFADARLDNVNFDGAYTYLTRFEGVDLTRTQNLSQVQIDLSCGDQETRLPEGLTVPEHWPCEE